MSQFNDPNMGMPPKKKSGMGWILILILVLLGLPLVCCGGCAVVTWFGYQQGIKQVAAEVEKLPKVKEELGDGLTLTMNISATTEEAGKNPPPPGKPGLVVFDAKGSKGSGQVLMRQTPGDGKMHPEILRVPGKEDVPLP